ncbi:MAG: tetratricopeptide repeat protein [Segetibacter sp.]|nr:tetratricopeptide repeat protein [Segetibacter sp.]
MKSLIFSVLLLLTSICNAQGEQDPMSLHETAKGFLRQGDYENALLVLNKTLQQKPNDLEVLKDILFANYLKRDFAKAMEIGKPLVDRTDADVPVFQMMGMVYKSIAENKEAEKVYKKGMAKFPDAGVLYSEYGDLLAEKEIDNALKLWEKGIELEPNHSSNYYYVAKQYAQKGEILWSILYAEMFLNMESFTPRSTEIKNLLLDQYKRFFTAASPAATYTAKKAAGNSRKANDLANKANEFSKNVAEALYQQASQASYGITPETLVAIRTRFILDWYEKYADKYPFRLFEHQRQLLQEGMFEAYNYWLFGPAANLKTYQLWQQYHQAELDTFLTFVRSKVFKVPEGQQYKAF